MIANANTLWGMGLTRNSIADLSFIITYIMIQISNYNVSSITGKIVDIAKELPGKTVCFSTEVTSFAFKYLVHIQSVTIDEKLVTLSGIFDDGSKTFEMTHSSGHDYFQMFWVVTPKN